MAILTGNARRRVITREPYGRIWIDSSPSSHYWMWSILMSVLIAAWLCPSRLTKSDAAPLCYRGVNAAIYNSETTM